jgi:hypothetical protein
MGSVLATLLSSAGPVFVAESFAEQRDYLRSIPGLVSPQAWSVMWANHVTRAEVVPFGAISAMPSLHVATPVFLLCVGVARYRWMLWPGLAYLAVSFLSTVYLGWHYALDGYVAIVLVLVCWLTYLKVRRPLQ